VLADFNNTTDEFGAGFTTGRSGEGSLLEKKRKPVVAEMKARQAAKIRELGHALVDSGFMTLDEQAKALGLARSTTWTILRASHKGSGLRPPSSNACCCRHSFLRSPDGKFLNTQRTSSKAYMAAAGGNDLSFSSA